RLRRAGGLSRISIRHPFSGAVPMAVERPDVEAVFHAARQKPPQERAAYLDLACGDDPALRGRVEQFLAAQAGIGSFLESPAPDLTATRDLPGVTHCPD